MAKEKVFTYNVEVNWISENKGILNSEGKDSFEIATPPEFGGHKGIWSPEDLLVASVTSCMMTTFLYYAHKSKLELNGYSSNGKGFLKFGTNGLEFTNIEIYVNIDIKREDQRDLCENLLNKAKKSCLISRAIKPEVTLNYNIRVSE